MTQRLRAPLASRLPPLERDRLEPAEAATRFPRAAFVAAVERALEYIRAGDIFQVVLSRRMSAPFSAAPLDLYRALRVINPSPYMFLLRPAGCAATLVGASPEVLVGVDAGGVRVRPIAGTRPRSANAAEDARLAAELLADPKERAEHAMLVDLGRNDLGRVCEHGSVELAESFVLERYSHVMHIVSAVRGRLAAGRDALDALAACLPAGTVSGAPKLRAMQIIDELEPLRRGPYAGAVGYLDYRGNLDACIAIRTVLVMDGYAHVQAGAGIVADSHPEREFEETEHKARALLAAIALARRFAAE